MACPLFSFSTHFLFVYYLYTNIHYIFYFILFYTTMLLTNKKLKVCISVVYFISRNTNGYSWNILIFLQIQLLFDPCIRNPSEKFLTVQININNIPFLQVFIFTFLKLHYILLWFWFLLRGLSYFIFYLE